MTLQKIYDSLKRLQPAAEKFLFPAVLFFWPFFGVLQGADITDTTYALGYYLYAARLDRMWYFATFLPNVLGGLLLRLPFGHTLAGMNVYCTLFICLTALSVYYLLRRFDLPSWMNFLGLFLAESLVWCPRVILYNHLTNLLMTLGILLLTRGLVAPVAKKRSLFFAGALLGLNIMVRLPNLLEIVLLAVIPMYGRWMRKKKWTVTKELFVTLCGYVAGFFVPFATISLVFDREAYVRMVRDLFAMTAESSDYTAPGMLSLIADAYAQTFSHMAVMIPCIAAGVVMFLLWKDRFLMQKRLLYAAGCVILMVYFFHSGIFTTNYWYYDAVFTCAMMFVIVSAVLFIIDVIGLLGGHEQERMLSFASLLILFITPLGSNNYTYPVLNNLFFAAPVALSVLRRAVRCARRTDVRLAHETWQMLLLALFAVLMVQGILFHLRFSFRDGMTDGTKRSVRISEIPSLRHIATTPEHAERLTNLYLFLEEQGLTGSETVLFGDIPGLAFLFDLPPAIFTTWPDLNSNTTARFDEALTALTAEPLVIIRGNGTGYEMSERKYNLLQMYLLQHEYIKIYEQDGFTVYEPEGVTN